MCIIITADSNIKISDKHIMTAYEFNPDGFGIGASINGKLFTFKSIDMNSKDIIKLYNSIRKLATGTIVLHFRIATKGKVTDNLCHPFYVNKDLIMFHNGVEIDKEIAGHSYKNQNESDTKAFVNNVLKNFKKGFQNNKNIMKMISNSVGQHNKLCFLDSTGKATYSSSDLWVEYNGILYSNTNIFYSNEEYRDINPATNEYIMQDDYEYWNEHYDEYIDYKDCIDYYKDYTEIEQIF